MNRLTALALLALLAGCDDKGGSSTIVYQVPSNLLYVSGDLGAITVLGSNVEARARFTFNPDEYAFAVHVEADYVPSANNAGAATGELALYDTKGDGDSLNDVLVGQLPPSSPWSRGRLDPDQPGTFSILCPLGAGTSECVGPQISTLGVRLRINTSAWYGTVTSYRIRIVTMKGVEPRDAPSSFLRDQ